MRPDFWLETTTVAREEELDRVGNQVCSRTSSLLVERNALPKEERGMFLASHNLDRARKLVHSVGSGDDRALLERTAKARAASFDAEKIALLCSGIYRDLIGRPTPDSV